MSPEQATGGARLDGRSDIYSLACVLYEMLAGDPPYVASSAQAVAARQSMDPVPRLRTVREKVPAAVEQVIGQALAKVPADRFATAAAFAEALQAAMTRSEEHTSELQSRLHLVCRLLLEKKKKHARRQRRHTRRR